MTHFCFIRHGEADYSEAETKIYQGWGLCMVPLTDKGVLQLKNAAKDKRLKDAQLIITSPFGRAMHSAAILSKELNIDIKVETDLHEWIVDIDYKWLTKEEANNRRRLMDETHGKENDIPFESAAHIKERVNGVLRKYSDYSKVIVVCHGILMQYFLGISHPTNAQIEEYIMEEK